MSVSNAEVRAPSGMGNALTAESGIVWLRRYKKKVNGKR